MDVLECVPALQAARESLVPAVIVNRSGSTLRTAGTTEEIAVSIAAEAVAGTGRDR